MMRGLRQSRVVLAGAALAIFGLITIAALGQRRRYQAPNDDEAIAPPHDAEFHFIRTQYTDLPQYHRGFGFASRDGQGSGWWIVDWPDADNHFTKGIERLTRIDTGD